MFKFKVIAFIFLTAMFISAKAYCQQETKDRQVSTVSGKVTNVDIEGGVINVQTDNGGMVFYILAESNLLQSSHHISSIEIGKNDPVTIQYFISSGKNDIVSLVDNKSAS